MDPESASPPSRTLMLAILWMGLLLVPATLFADDPQETGHGQDVHKLCKELEAQYKNKKDRDTQRIITVYQIFDGIYSRATAREQKTIARTIRKAYDIQPFPEDSSFMMTGAACLSAMGKNGLDALLYAVNHKNLKTRPGQEGLVAMGQVRVKETLIEAIGFNKDPSALKTLYRLLPNDEPTFIKATCRALSCFSELTVKERKSIVENLVDVYSRLHAEAEAGGDESKAHETLIAVEVAFNMALQKLTYRTFESAPDWRKWFEENKEKEEW